MVKHKCVSRYIFFDLFKQYLNKTKQKTNSIDFFFDDSWTVIVFFGLAKKNVYQPLDEMVFVVSAPIIIIIMTLCRYFFPPANFDVLFFSSAASKTKTKQKKM